MILGPLLAASEIAVNQLLRLDVTTLQRLAALEGKVIQVSIKDWGYHFNILPNAGGVQLVSSPITMTADCVIMGKLLDLGQVFCQGGNNVALFKYGLTITGDTELAEQLRDIMLKLDIDWEALITRILGDTVGQHVAWRLRDIARFALQTRQTLCQNIVEYCQAEANYLPLKHQVEQFYHDIAEVRDGVERAALRYERLVKQNPSLPPLDAEKQ